MKWSTLSAAALLIFSNVASADFVRTDWKASGDGLATLHEETGIEWLRLTQTDNMSMAQVKTEIQSGGLFEGWRLPTSDEVEIMMEGMYPSYAFDEPNYNDSVRHYGSTTYTGSSDWRAHIRDNWSEAFGILDYRKVGGYGADFFWRSYGLYENDTNDPALEGELLMSGMAYDKRYASASRRYNYRTYIYHEWENSVYVDEYTHNMHGVYLVSDGGTTLSSRLDPTLNIENPNAPVNVPLIGSAIALLGLFGVRRKIA